jgi:two-component system, OmpR family, sensor histidine kinase ChvG
LTVSKRSTALAIASKNNDFEVPQKLRHLTSHMLDTPKPQEQVDRLEPDDGSELQNSLVPATGPKGGFWNRFAPGSLIARIFLINLLGLFILALGTLYFNQFRESLINARAQSLRTQAQIISAAIAGSASADTGSIVIDPNSLDEGADTSGETDQLDGLDFPINPESAGPVLRRLLANTGNRAQIIDQGGNLVVDSRFIYGGDVIETVDDKSHDENLPWWQLQWNRLLTKALGYDYPLRREYGIDNNKAMPEVAAALNGASVSQVKLDENREIVVVVSVPVQRYRAVLGALVLTNKGGEIDDVLRAERLVVLYTFGLASLVTLLLSALLASTIANPIRRLSAAAQQVRRGISKRVEIPDFSTRKDEIGHLSGSLREMTGALYNRIDAIEAFAADVAHELKNPLTSLRSAVETLQLVKKDEQRNRLIEIVKQDVKRMDRLITDISDASRLDAELARTESQPTDLAKLLGAIAMISNELAKPHMAEVVLNIQVPHIGLTDQDAYAINGQESRLSQVFRNLIDNARSFTAPGSKVNVRLRRAGNVIEARIEDQGPGIRPENLERVFERFYTDRPEHSFGNNSGLGLAISRQIVEAHKGRIWAENRYGRANAEGEKAVLGARFLVQLPALDAPDNP